MKKLLLVKILALILITSCNKDDDGKSCYECDFENTGTFSDKGCYSKEDWNSITFTNENGVPYNKDRCRKK